MHTFRRWRRRHPDLWMLFLLVVGANFFVGALLASYNAGWVK